MSCRANWALAFVIICVAGCGGTDVVSNVGDPDGSAEGGSRDAGRTDGAATDMATPTDMASTDMFMADAGTPGTAGIIVIPTSGLRTSEDGGTAGFGIVLTSAPSADVVIALSSSDTTEGTVSPASVTFTPVNWNAPQTVTVTGVDDTELDGVQTYTIVTEAAVSTDAAYSGRNGDDVSVGNIDDESPGVTVTPGSGLATTESGGTATFSIVLVAAPSADVTISLESNSPTEVSVSPATVTFTTANWSSEQTVTVTGLDDSIADGDAAFTILTGDVESADTAYDGLTVADVSGVNLDDEMAGIDVTPVSGLSTTEAGGTAMFAVVLRSEPAADVAIDIASSDTTEGTLPSSSLTFTAANWNVAQAVLVTGANDPNADGDQIYQITVGPATSTDANYNGIGGASVELTNSDDESAGLIVTPVTGLVTTEGGGTATFTVALRTEPTAAVAVDVTGNDASEGTASPTTLNFAVADWDTPQTVTMTGVDDFAADGDQIYSVTLRVSATADAAYLSLSDRQVEITNTDNETPGITVNPTTGLVTTEAGGTATFSIVLNSEPSASVIILLASDLATEGVVTPATVTFSPGTWNVPQTVTVAGVNDATADGSRVYHITTSAASSGDSAYNGLNASDVTVTNTDDDVVGVTVTPVSGLTTGEGGGTASFTIVLTSQPTADVAIALSNSDVTEASLGLASVAFTTANWNTPQTVTLTGVDDPFVDGNVAYSIATSPAVSTDSAYNGINANDVLATNTDNDVASIVVTPASGLTTSEAMGTSTFTVVLTSQPSEPVTIALTTSDATEGTMTPASLTFSPSNWNMPQTVNVIGVDDSLDDGDVAYLIATGAATSVDTNYNGMTVSDVSVTNTDNDTAGVTVSPTTGLTTSEGLTSASFAVVLNSQPTANVTIGFSSSDTTEGTVSVASLTFTVSNWNIAQSVSVTGVDDAIADGSISYTIVTGATVSTDASYNTLAVPDVTVSNTDNDLPGVMFSSTSGYVTHEAGGMAMFQISLTTMPSANVTISLTSNDLTEGTVALSSVTFTTANWNVPQGVAITGVNDQFDDGNVAYTIVTGDATSGDSAYNGLVVSDVSVTNTDDDTAGFIVTPTSGLGTTEAGSTTSFTIFLTAQPTANVSISIASSDSTEGSVSPAVVMFTTATWNTPQTVTITGVDDFIFDGNVSYTIVTGAATSTDLAFSGLAVPDVSATTADNDTAGVDVNPTGGLFTTEAGGTATFTMRLYSQPSADVTIALSSSTPTEGTVSPASVTFTSANWNILRTVTITGVGDLANDANTNYTIITGQAVSSDPIYSMMLVSDVNVTNTSMIGQQAYVKASNPDSNDIFGYRVALSSDGSTLAVAALAEDGNSPGVNGAQNNSSSDAGAVYVYARTGAAWVQQAYIKPSNPDVNDGFGTSLALSSDGTTLAVGATQEDAFTTGINGMQNNIGSQTGAVYVFTRAGSTWSQQAYVKASNTGSDNFFGSDVSLSSDGSTLAVGARWEESSATGVGGDQSDNSASFAGAVYVFTRAGTVWTQQAYVKASNTAASDGFGYTVALSLDGNTLAVAANGEDSNATGINGDQTNNASTDAGAVYLFVRAAGVWSQQAYIKASNSGASDLFGSALALSTDGNTLAVGAVYEDSNATGIGGNQASNAAGNAGAVYVFTRSATTWTQQAYVKPANTDAADEFGLALSLAADGNSLVVGSHNEDSAATGLGGDATSNAASNAGGIYVFKRVGMTWAQNNYIKASNTDAADEFGWSVAVSGDASTIAVGATGEDSNASGVNGSQSDNSLLASGAAYVFAPL
ncbi:MAG: hypothetical protein IPK60_11505 [Sandaracinaceae bacterium]|nr:hypothetical protein [Sandaracinaceae bacterium]